MATELLTLTLIRRANGPAEFIDRTTDERFDPAGLSLVFVSTAADWWRQAVNDGLAEVATAKVYEMSGDGRRIESMGYLLPREMAHSFLKKFWEELKAEETGNETLTKQG